MGFIAKCLTKQSTTKYSQTNTVGAIRRIAPTNSITVNLIPKISIAETTLKQLIKIKHLLSFGVSMAIAITLIPVMQASTFPAPNYTIKDLGSQYRVDWVGNSFPGTKIISNKARRHVQQQIEDIFVTPEGIVYSNSRWDERFAQASAYQDGKQTLIMEKMLGWGRKGGYAVTADRDYVYVAVEERNINRSRLNRYANPVYPQPQQVWYSVRRYNAKTGKVAGFNQGHGIDGGSIVINTDSGHIQGLAIYQQRLYVSDTANNQIKVYDLNNLTQQPIFSWSVDNPGKLAFDLNGNLWVVRHQTNQIISFTPDGQLQKQITLPANSIASDIAINNQQLLVTDIGQEQNIKIYDNIATQPQYKGNLGEIGGIFAGDTGKFAPLKFYQPKGVGTDKQGNIYVAQDAWASVGGGGAIIESYKPDKTLAWRVHSLEFMSSLDIDYTEQKLYSKERVYNFNPDQKSGATTTYEGITLNPQQFPDDPRIHDHFTGVELHYFADNPILFMLQRMGRSIALYRFDKENYGETAIPYAMFYTVRHKDLKWNTNQPKNKEWIWIDKNLNGQFDKDEFTVNPSVVKGTFPITTGWYVAPNGTIWTVAKTLIRKFSPLESATGYPVWNPNFQEFKIPDPFVEVRRVLYDSASDSMYLTGYTPDAPYTGEWKAMGKAIARFDNWSSSPTLQWIRETPWYYNNNSPREKPVAIDIAGDYVFIGLESTGKQDSIDKQSTVFVYDKAQGNYIGSMQHKGKVAPIMLDKMTGLNAKKTADGNYLIFLEDAAYARSIIFHWNPQQ